MNTPGHTAAQRVIHTSDAFFRKFIHVWHVFAGMLAVYTFFWEPDSFYAGALCVLCGLIAWGALRTGHAALVRWLFITPFFVLLMVGPWLVNGLRTPLMAHMMLLLIFTGWMLGIRVMWICALCLGASVLTLWYVEAHGLWQMPQPLRGADMWLIALLFSLFLTTVSMTALLYNYQADIQRETTWQERLHHALQFNQLIVDASPVPIRVFDAREQCIAVNEACALLVGQRRETLLKETLEDTMALCPALVEACREVLHQGAGPVEREVQFTTRDGRLLWLHVHLMPFDRNGERHLLAHTMDMTERHHATQELREMAFHDGLTGLANRRLFWEQFHMVQQLCIRTRQWGAVLLLDLNRFKQLNDLHGHEAGDAMLREVARRLQHTVRGSDVIARLGGDEFTLVVQSLGSTEAQAQQHLATLRDKLHAALAQPYHLGDITHHASASIGEALIDPDSTLDLEALLRQADAQMYAQKKARTLEPTPSHDV